MKVALAGHIQGIVRQPPGVIPAELLRLLPIPLPSPGLGPFQQSQPVVIKGGIVHLGRVPSPVHGGNLSRLQQPILRQQVQVNEPGIARVCGIGGIGGISMAGGSQGQHLPPGLARLRQKIHKHAGGPAQGPNTVGRGQSGNGKQNSRGTFHNGFLTFSSGFPLVKALRGPAVIALDGEQDRRSGPLLRTWQEEDACFPGPWTLLYVGAARMSSWEKVPAVLNRTIWFGSGRQRLFKERQSDVPFTPERFRGSSPCRP